MVTSVQPTAEIIAELVGQAVSALRARGAGEAPSGLRGAGEAPSGLRGAGEAPSGPRGAGEAPSGPRDPVSEFGHRFAFPA
jgi:hypothetical protein